MILLVVCRIAAASVKEKIAVMSLKHSLEQSPSTSKEAKVERIIRITRRLQYIVRLNK